MQALLINAVIILTTALLVTGCAPATSSRGVSSRIAFEEVNVRCVNVPGMKQTRIIRMEAEYQALFLNKKYWPECTQYVSPPIDFSKKTLLRFEVPASGCKTPEFRPEILYSRSTKRYTFSVNVTEYSICRTAIARTYWATIPKIKKGAEVDFKVVKNVLP
jgi:hypothetical protein